MSTRLPCVAASCSRSSFGLVGQYRKNVHSFYLNFDGFPYLAESLQSSKNLMTRRQASLLVTKVVWAGYEEALV